MADSKVKLGKPVNVEAAAWLRTAIEKHPSMTLRHNKRYQAIPFRHKHWAEMYKDDYLGNITIHISFKTNEEIVAMFAEFSAELGDRCREYLFDRREFNKWIKPDIADPFQEPDKMPDDLETYVPEQAAHWLVDAVRDNTEVTFAPFSMSHTYVHPRFRWSEMYSTDTLTTKAIFLRGNMEAIADIMNHHSRELGDRSRDYLSHRFRFYSKWM